MNIRALSLTVIALFCIAYGLVYSRIEILVFGMSLVLYMLLTYITLRIKCANMRFIVSKQLDRQSIEKKGIKISINAKTNSKVYFDVIDKAPKNIVGGSNIVRDCKDNADFTYSLMFKNYGVFQTGPTIAKMHDLQGLFYFEKKIYNSSYVIVYPSNIEVSKMRFKVTEKTLSSLLGTRRTAEKGFGTEFVAIREYHPGDDIRNIDWKASARLNKMMMRTFQVERKQRIFLLLDVGQNMNLHNSMIDSSVYSSIYLSQLIISRKDVLGFGLFSDTLKTFISHVKTRQHLMNLVKQIAMQTFDKKTDYVACLKRMGVAAKKRCAIILITNIMEESPEELLQAFKYLANHSVHIICPYEPYFEAKSDDLLEKVVYRIALHRYEMKFQERANILKQLGINCYRVGPDNIGIKLTQIYLSIVKKDLALV